MYVDVGIYGTPAKLKQDPLAEWDHVECHKDAEKFLRKIGGFQALYANTYQTREVCSLSIALSMSKLIE
jgi:hypothetical protein